MPQDSQYAFRQPTTPTVYAATVITHTCQVCGTALKLEDGTSIEAFVRRGRGSGDEPSDEEEYEGDYWDWGQKLLYRFCGEEHMRSWMSALSLPAYEPPADGEKASPLETLAEGFSISMLVAVLLAVLTGAVYGFLLLLARVF